MGDRFEPKSLTFKASKRPYRKISDGRYFAFNPIPHYGYYKIRLFFGIIFFPPLEDDSAHSTLTQPELLWIVLNGNVFGFRANKSGLLTKKLFCNITYMSYCVFYICF